MRFHPNRLAARAPTGSSWKADEGEQRKLNKKKKKIVNFRNVNFHESLESFVQLSTERTRTGQHINTFLITKGNFRSLICNFMEPWLCMLAFIRCTVACIYAPAKFIIISTKRTKSPKKKRNRSGDTYSIRCAVPGNTELNKKGQLDDDEILRWSQKRKDQRQVHFRYGFMLSLFCAAVRAMRERNIFAYCTWCSTPKKKEAETAMLNISRQTSLLPLGGRKFFFARREIIVLPDKAA